MPAPIANNARSIGRLAGAEAPPPEAPDIIEGLGAGFREAKDRVPWVQDKRLEEAYIPVYQALTEQNGKGWFDYTDWGASLNPFNGNNLDYDLIWQDVAAQRARDPKAFADIPATREEFERGILSRQGQHEADAQTAARAGFAVRMAGSVPAQFFDPINVAAGIVTGGVSRGAGIIKGMAIEGLANAVIEAGETPLLMRADKRLGIETSGEDIAMNVGSAFLFGGAMHLGGRGAAAGKTRFVDAMARHANNLPGPLRERWQAHLLSKADPLDDPVLLADLADAIVGPENFSEQLRAASVAARREGGIDAASPFVGTGAGTDMHVAMATEAMRAALEVNPLTSASGNALARSLAPINDNVQTRATVGAEQRFMERVRRAESDGDDTAANPRSSAAGRYQFTNATWLAYYKRRYGDGGLSNRQILAKKRDGNLQDTLMGDLTAANAAVLRRAGHMPNEGNLYLAHFAGADGARRVLDADPSARVEDVLGAKVVKANPFLRDKSVDWLVRWAHKKMGSSASARPVELRGDLAEALGDDGQRALDAAIDRAARADEATRAANDDPGEQLGEALEASLEPVERADMPEAGDPLEPRAQEVDAPAPEVLAALPRLREIIDGRERSLNKTEQLARDLGVDEVQLRQAMGEMVREGRITVNRKSGNWMRKPKAPDGPEDVLDFLARNGGIRDDEGHALGLVGVSAREQRELHPAAIKNVRRRRSGGGRRDWQRMTRRNGKLLRHEGRSIDAVGELLDEAGYLHGADGGRPTTREVLEYLDERINGGEQAFPVGEGVERSWEEDYDDMLRAESLDNFIGLLEDRGESWSAFGDDFLEAASEIYRLEADNPAMTPGLAAEIAASRRIDAELDNAIDRTGDSRYDDVYDDFANTYGPDGRLTGVERYAEYARGDVLEEGGEARNGRTGPEDSRGGAGEGGTGSEARAGDSRAQPSSGQALADLPPEDRAPFIDGDGAASRAQADSLAHDARAKEDFDAVWKDKAFRAAFKKRGLPHRESHVAAEMVQGWRDGAGNDLSGIEAQVRDIDTKSYTAQGNNPVVPYVEGFHTRVFGEEVEVRSVATLHDKNHDGVPVISAAQAWAQIDAKVNGLDGDAPRVSEGGDGQMDFAAPTQEQRRTALERQGEGRMKATKAQKAPGEDGGLFDSRAQDETFRFDDEGDEQSLGQLLDDIDAEETELKNIRDCL